jgi:hypothetical protein
MIVKQFEDAKQGSQKVSIYDCKTWLHVKAGAHMTSAQPRWMSELNDHTTP